MAQPRRVAPLGWCRTDQRAARRRPARRKRRDRPPANALHQHALRSISNISTITDRLIAAGRSADTPAAAVQEGSTPRQRSVRSTLGKLVEAVEQAALQAPVALIIGETVELADELAWYEPEEMQYEAPRLATV